jgi:hypothetical protein
MEVGPRGEMMATAIPLKNASRGQFELAFKHIAISRATWILLLI